MAITRFDRTQPPGPRMSRCVVRGDTVYLAGLTAGDTSQDQASRYAQPLAPRGESRAGRVAVAHGPAVPRGQQ